MMPQQARFLYESPESLTKFSGDALDQSVTQQLSSGPACSSEHDLDGPKQVLDVLTKGELEDVFSVEVKPITKVTIEAQIRRLVGAGHPWFHIVADVIGIAALFGNVRNLRTWPNKAHLPTKHVGDLWQLVEAQLTHPATKAGVARVLVRFVTGTPILRLRYLGASLATIWTHRAELVDRERFTVFANAFLGVQHRSTKTHTNSESEQRSDRSSSDCGCRADDDVEWSLASALVPSAVTDDSKIFVGGSTSVEVCDGGIGVFDNPKPVRRLYFTQTLLHVTLDKKWARVDPL